MESNRTEVVLLMRALRDFLLFVTRWIEKNYPV
jgi:hypothetical protein